ncbi:MAG: helix-turn-helix transcriptional regulator [Clostridia bacterium]|nr:helix-turn-helix transcriptional regulator [Clostridia bacterium]
MDQIKIGKFISKCRKEKSLTQMQLAEKLGITDRAISKWETGKSLPDSSIMLELCEMLGITVNDLLSGEVVTVSNYNEKLEKNLISMVKEKEKADKRLLSMEIFIVVLVSAILLSLVFTAAFDTMADWLRVCLIVIGFVVFTIGVVYAVKIEQTAGYYECAQCGHKHIPTFSSVLWSMHMGRTRYMKCPKCGKKSWQKKVISK